MATILDAAGLPAPAISDGVSILPSLTRNGKQRKSLIYSEYFEGGKTPAYKEFAYVNRSRIRNQMQMIRMGNNVGVRYNIRSNEDDFQIYNVRKDFHQQYNLAERKNLSVLQRRMKDRVLQVRRVDTNSRRPYDTVAVPAFHKVAVSKGLIWKSYHSTSQWIPSTNGLKIISQGKSIGLNPKIVNKDSNNLVVLEGFIKIPKDGNYTFHLSAQGKAFLRIHGAVLIDADFGYAPNNDKQSTIKLQAGLHPIKLYYQRFSEKEKNLELSWSNVMFNNQPIPSEAFFY